MIRLSKPTECPVCGSSFDSRKGFVKAYVNQNCFRKATDLQFRGTGICRKVIKYLSGRYKCTYCRSIFTIEDFKKLEKYGHGLTCFIVYFNVALILPIRRIQDSLLDLFGMPLTTGTIQWLTENLQKIKTNSPILTLGRAVPGLNAYSRLFVHHSDRANSPLSRLATGF